MTPEHNQWLWNPEIAVRVQQLFGQEWEIPFRMLTLTTDSPVIMILVSSLFWTRGRRLAYTVLAAAMIGAMLATVLKVGIDIPRPDHPDLMVFEDRISPSFPSGHAMYAVAFWGSLAWFGIIRWSVPVAMLVIASLSRLFLGIHYPADLIAGAAVGSVGLAAGIAIQRKLIPKLPDQHLSVLVGVGFLGSVVMVPIAGDFPLGWEILGGLIGAGFGTLIESRRIGYRPSSVPIQGQVLRLAIGLGGMLILLTMGAALRDLTANGVAHSLFFVPVGVWAMLVTPYVLQLLGHNLSLRVGPGSARQSSAA